MKILCFIILIIISIAGCKKHREDQTNSQPTTFDRQHPDYREFKKVFFLTCIAEGYNNSKEIRSIMDKDMSTMGDFPLGLSGYRLIDSLALVAKQQIYLDSIKIHDRFDYSAGKKRAFSICLKLYESEWLDSIASRFCHDQQ